MRIGRIRVSFLLIQIVVGTNTNKIDIDKTKKK